MDAKVLIPFTDKYTGKKYKKDDVIKGISAKRFNEMLEKGKLVAAVDDTTAAKTEKK